MHGLRAGAAGYGNVGRATTINNFWAGRVDGDGTRAFDLVPHAACFHLPAVLSESH